MVFLLCQVVAEILFPRVRVHSPMDLSFCHLKIIHFKKEEKKKKEKEDQMGGANELSVRFPFY